MSRRIRLTVDWTDEGEPDYIDGQEAGYLKFMNALTDLGLEIVDERQLPD